MTLIERVYRKLWRITSLALHASRSKTQSSLSVEEVRAITAYREHIKIYDAFIFFNELELLNMRLNILDPYVDFFVIVESTVTFSGKPKELYYAKNADRFTHFAHKIIHHVIDDTPSNRAELENRLTEKSLSALEKEIITETLSNSNVPKGQDMWLREFYQRESIKQAFIGLSDTDMCYISDVDEIWNPEAIIDYHTDVIYKYKQIVYSYYLNNRSSEPWAGTFATPYKRIRTSCLGDMRDAAKTVYTYVPNGGWHFTNQGGATRIAKKIESYSHQEFNTPDIKSRIEAQIAENKDFVGRHFTFSIDESALPRYIVDSRSTYPSFFKDHE